MMYALLLLGGLCADPAGATLRGTVVDGDGKAITGARVNIATGAPKVGQGIFCPSCYRDCAKWTTSDDKGRFEFRNLDPALKFTVLVTAPTRRARWTKLFDPQTDEPKIVLEKLPANVPPEQVISGDIVDDRGAPIAGALVELVGGKTADRHWYGLVSDVDPTMSDAKGGFTLYLPPGYLQLDVFVAAYGYAGATITLKPGRERHRVVVPWGTRVSGRLVHAGQPVAGQRVAVVQMNRMAGHHFIKAVGDVTGADGKFVISHLPADEQYAIFSPVGEGPQKLVMTTKKFTASGNREARDLGDLELITPVRLAGRIEMPGGQPLPPNTRVAIDRDPAWDLIAAPVDKDGRFVVEGLPPETYHVRVAAKGFAIDGARVPYQMLQGGSFGLRLRESIDDLRIPLRVETGEDRER